MIFFLHVYFPFPDVQETVPLEGILRQLSVPVHREADCQDTLRNVTRSEILASSDSFLCAGGTGDGSACYVCANAVV